MLSCTRERYLGFIPAMTISLSHFDRSARMALGDAGSQRNQTIPAKMAVTGGARRSESREQSHQAKVGRGQICETNPFFIVSSQSVGYLRWRGASIGFSTHDLTRRANPPWRICGTTPFLPKWRLPSTRLAPRTVTNEVTGHRGGQAARHARGKRMERSHRSILLP
jgi:hypothetical protein